MKQKIEEIIIGVLQDINDDIESETLKNPMKEK